MTTTGPSIRVLVVQQESAAREQLIRVLQHDGDIRVMGPASTADEAIRTVQRDHPDLVIVDLQLTGGGSQHVIEQIMAGNPTPILVMSDGIEDRRSPSAVAALVAGALDALPSRTVWSPATELELRHAVRQLHKVTVIRHPRGGRAAPADRQVAPGTRQPVVAVGASTGGPAALGTVLSGLAGLAAPVLIVQHLHPDFTSGLLDMLARSSGLPIQIAEDNALLQRGHAYLAPGHLHLRLGPGLRISLTPQPVSLHRPSADELLLSVAEHAGPAGVGVLLTGMGEDGARGMLAMHLRGAATFAQDEASCAVYGMPRAAVRLGAVTGVLPLSQMAAGVRRAVTEIRS